MKRSYSTKRWQFRYIRIV